MKWYAKIGILVKQQIKIWKDDGICNRENEKSPLGSNFRYQ
jgi:hypothetical protein